MLYISVDEIKYSTVGATFKVAFSVPIDELPQLRELHDKYAELNMTAFGLTASTADTPQTERDCFTCKHDNTGDIECQDCDDDYSGYEPKQTDCPWK